MSALPPIATAKADISSGSCQADMCSALADVCFGPKRTSQLNIALCLRTSRGPQQSFPVDGRRLLKLSPTTRSGLATGRIAQTRSKAILLPCHIFPLVVPARIQASEREPNPRGSRAVTGVPRNAQRRSDCPEGAIRFRTSIQNVLLCEAAIRASVLAWKRQRVFRRKSVSDQ